MKKAELENLLFEAVFILKKLTPAPSSEILDINAGHGRREKAMTTLQKNIIKLAEAQEEAEQFVKKIECSFNLLGEKNAI